MGRTKQWSALVLCLGLLSGCYKGFKLPFSQGIFGSESMVMLTGKITPLISEDIQNSRHNSELYFVTENKAYLLKVYESPRMTTNSFSQSQNVTNQFLAQPSTSMVSIKGVLSENTIHAFKKDIMYFSPTNPTLHGSTNLAGPTYQNKSVIVLLANFSDKNLKYTNSQINDFFFGNLYSVKKLLEESSGGSFTISGKVVGPYAIPKKSTDGCGRFSLDDMGDKLEDIAKSKGEYNGSADIEFVVLPEMDGCDNSGTAPWIGKRAYAMRTYPGWEVHLFSHELHHVLGLNHSGTKDEEYGDETCFMGRGYGQLNAPQRDAMGFIPRSQRRDVTQSGMYSLLPVAAASNGGVHPQMLRAGKLHIAWRGPENFLQDRYKNKLFVHEWDGSFSSLVGLNGEKAILRTVLDVGQDFTDLRAGWRVKNLGINNGVMQVEIGKPSNLPPPPSLSLSLSHTTIKKGEVSYLSWSTTGATSVYVDTFGRSFPGDFFPDHYSAAEMGETGMSIAPSETMTISVTATGNGGSTTKTIQINVTDYNPVTCSLSANPNSITEGENATWEAHASASNLIVFWYVLRNGAYYLDDSATFGDGGHFVKSVSYPNFVGTESRIAIFKHNISLVEMCRSQQALLQVRQYVTPTATPTPTPTPDPTPTPTPTPVCGVTVSNGSVVANGPGTAHPTVLTFTRTGNANGAFFWSTNFGPWIAQRELDSRDSSLPLPYLNIPAGTYQTRAEVREGSTITSCGSFSVTVVAAPSPTPAPQLTCTLGVTNGGTAANGPSSVYPTSLTFSRSGTATGDFYWSANNAPMFNQPELNGNPSSFLISYIGSAGVYSIKGEIRNGATITPCGTITVNILAGASPSPTPTPTCALGVNNGGYAANGSGTNYTTSLTFTRSGTANGSFYWSANNEPMFNQPELNGNPSSFFISYIGRTAGVYSIKGEVRNGSTVTSCGTITVTIVAAPAQAGCTLSVTNNGLAANGPGTTLPTTLIFSRSGPATGLFYWSANNGAMFNQPELNNTPSSFPISYSGQATGSYTIRGEVRNGLAVTPCGTINISIRAAGP